ncbi:hypothetical protein F5B21DRAFT_98423 [Xylaria acuta]|nr:hypothetical protein F5B21DRAFT_98423 [Xylaria acuta]
MDRNEPEQPSIMVDIFEVLILIWELMVHFLSSILLSFFKLFVAIAVFALIILGGVTQIANVGLWGSYLPPPISHHKTVFPNARVLALNENINLNATEFRLLVNISTPEKVVKYATVSFDVKALGVREEPYSSTNVVHMPFLPDGDWCSVSIGLTSCGKQISFTTTSCQRLPGVEGAWHETDFDFLDLEILKWPNETDRVKLVRHSALTTPESRAVMKYAPFADTVPNISREIQMYQHVQGSDAAPKLLGQVVEHGRVIGFLIEYVEKPRFVSRGEFSDLALDKCKQALSKLHNIGVKHNHAHPSKCIIREDGSAMFLDFEHATSVTIPGLPNPNDFEEDFQFLRNI